MMFARDSDDSRQCSDTAAALNRLIPNFNVDAHHKLAPVPPHVGSVSDELGL